MNFVASRAQWFRSKALGTADLFHLTVPSLCALAPTGLIGKICMDSTCRCERRTFRRSRKQLLSRYVHSRVFASAMGARPCFMLDSSGDVWIGRRRPAAEAAAERRGINVSSACKPPHFFRQLPHRHLRHCAVFFIKPANTAAAMNSHGPIGRLILLRHGQSR